MWLIEIKIRRLFLFLQHGSTQFLKPYQRRSSKTPIVRPLSRKDIFYSGSIYNLALDTMPEDKEKKSENSENAIKGYRYSVVSIPRDAVFSHRGSVVARDASINYVVRIFDPSHPFVDKFTT